jgi:carboxymethylenebutenolidase
MSKLVNIIAEDGFMLPAYLSPPVRKPKGGIVIIQEIFGLTQQLRDLADQYAALGYVVIVPALYARVTNDIELEYNQINKGLNLANECDTQVILQDIQSAVITLNHKRVSVIGFCWGGGLAYLAACELVLYSGVAYYGTRLLSYLPLKPKCPFQFHFGESDTHSPPEVIQKMKQSTTNCEFYRYPKVGHAFANHHKPSFNQEAASLAQNRVINILPR